MNFMKLKVSLIALALFAGPVTMGSAHAGGDGSWLLAQADQGNKRLDNIRKFLERGRNLERLDDDQLGRRLERARAFQEIPNLPDDLLAGLKQEEQELLAEIARRGQTGSSSAGSAGQSDAATGAGGAQQQTQSAAGATTGASSELDAFLASVKPPASLSDRELRQQMRKAAQLADMQGITPEYRRKLREIVRDSRAELASRAQGSQQGGAQDGVVGQAAGSSSQQQTAQTTGGGSADVNAFLLSVQPLDRLPNAELRQQMRKAQQLLQSSGISGEQRQKLRQLVRDSRAELERRAGAGNQQAGTGNQAGQMAGSGQQPGGGGNAAADARARELLAGNVDPQKLSNAELRKRLDAMRELLAANQLSPANRKALRERLASERVILRSRMSQRNATQQTNQTGTSQSGNVTGNNNTVNNTSTTINNTTTINREVVRQVVNDRRPARDLSDAELRRRIKVYDFAIRDNSFSERERVEWRGMLERDRRALRERLLTARDRRRDELRLRANKGNLDIRLGVDFRPDRPPPPRYVFAAEADDRELEEVLLAPPRRRIDRRYSIDDFERNPELRDAVARIEIDTVRFGFGESFVREEELDNLDRIAEIIEKILAVYPDEVFMIEGHTDAVGSDAANLKLSRERAAAVRQALVTYYVIPPENLKTVGFGERFLKIPTEEAEAENRRVSVARITPLVGALRR